MTCHERTQDSKILDSHTSVRGTGRTLGVGIWKIPSGFTVSSF